VRDDHSESHQWQMADPAIEGRVSRQALIEETVLLHHIPLQSPGPERRPRFSPPVFVSLPGRRGLGAASAPLQLSVPREQPPDPEI
jgi:hypothetical protein